jgi:hypothetical protein
MQILGRIPVSGKMFNIAEMLWLIPIRRDHYFKMIDGV